MWNEILDALLAYVASYTNQEDANVGTSCSHDDSTEMTPANDDIVMSAADEHAFLVAAKLLNEQNEENTDEDKERPANNLYDEDDDMTAFEELAFLAAAKLLNEQTHDKTKEDEGHPTNDWSNEDNDMTASEEDEFLIAAKLLNNQIDIKEDEDRPTSEKMLHEDDDMGMSEEHAFIVAAELLDEESTQQTRSRKRVRHDLETVVANRRRLQFQSVTVNSFPDDLGASCYERWFSHWNEAQALQQRNFRPLQGHRRQPSLDKLAAPKSSGKLYTVTDWNWIRQCLASTVSLSSRTRFLERACCVGCSSSNSAATMNACSSDMPMSLSSFACKIEWRLFSLAFSAVCSFSKFASN
ncbi:hypothetical protein AC1031_017201 [Aphanomyces cochlioides]|nr:hypothetical protein AC1031_017201 [Aphanomyces cochlioides]